MKRRREVGERGSSAVPAAKGEKSREEVKKSEGKSLEDVVPRCKLTPVSVFLTIMVALCAATR